MIRRMEDGVLVVESHTGTPEDLEGLPPTYARPEWLTEAIEQGTTVVFTGYRSAHPRVQEIVREMCKSTDKIERDVPTSVLMNAKASCPTLDTLVVADLDFDRDLLEKCLAMMETAALVADQHAGEFEPTFYEIKFWHDPINWLRPELDMYETKWADAFETGDWFRPTVVCEGNPVKVDAKMAHVSPGSVRWTAYQSCGGHLLETPYVTKSEIEAMLDELEAS